MEKFRNKYRIQSNRLQGWDYSHNGFYFITLVTQNKECNLGEIVDGRDARPCVSTPCVSTSCVSTPCVSTPCVSLSSFGEIVDNEWIKSFEIRNELFLDEYIIMPNHLHAIVVLEKNQTKINNMDCLHGTPVETHGRASQHRASQHRASLQFVRKPKSISSFIAGFKSSVNTKIDNYIDEYHLGNPKYNRKNHFFQSNYHDHIIRNEKEYDLISQYIIDNPSKWKTDKLNGGNGNIVMEQTAEYNLEEWMV